MRRRTWTVQWQACPRPDGDERLARAVAMLLDRASDVPSACPTALAAGEADDQQARAAGKERR
jgi:hypothetical protein